MKYKQNSSRIEVIKNSSGGATFYHTDKPCQNRTSGFKAILKIAERFAQQDKLPIFIRATNGQIEEIKKDFSKEYTELPQTSEAPLLLKGDCLKEMKNLPLRSIDLILVDLPYGTSQNKWDVVIPFDEMWSMFNRVIKDSGVIVLTAAQPFSSKLIMSNIDQFKYEIIWEKTIGSGQLNIKRQPLRTHESILIFYKKFGTYNEQTTDGVPYKIKRKVNFKGEGYGKQADSEKINDGFRHAKSIIKISNPRIKNGHPTQKPLALMEYLIKTFSNEGETVLDCCMGSGTTGVAARNLTRKFIGIELDESYFASCEERIISKYNKK